MKVIYAYQITERMRVIMYKEEHSHFAVCFYKEKEIARTLLPEYKVEDIIKNHRALTFLTWDVIHSIFEWARKDHLDYNRRKHETGK